MALGFEPSANIRSAEPEGNLSKRNRKGCIVGKSLPNLSLQQLYPAIVGSINLNCCGDPDCGNFGVAPDYTHHGFIGRNATARRQKAYLHDPALASGRGRYTITGDIEAQVVSTALEYADDPHQWEDGKRLLCRHRAGNRDCDVSFGILSNQHLSAEIDRLRTQNGSLEGPACGACGRRYLDNPSEFIFNGTHGKMAPGKNGRKSKASAFRLIHQPCKGQPGARFTVSLDHQQQENKHDNVRLLRALVNGASINSLRRLLADPDTGKKAGVSRVYNRIFWLEKVLLAFEQAKLKEWKEDAAAKPMAFDVLPQDPELLSALSRRYLRATIQPVSAFMNAMRERLNPTKRAGGRSSRNGPSYINGASFNPAVLFAFLNIYRVYYNWFEARPYASHEAKEDANPAMGGSRTIKRPGSDDTIEVPQRRKKTPALDTPAMRLGADTRKTTRTTQRPMDPRRVLYRP
ncbi:hypothetical protein ACFORG_20380 [Lutimaribacter marinistellae]|uniref:Uncharacterized protein n=1 Tax=Lutimaribacter marinistellae TaxID=1820329 RepID=A0ABV7TKM8_9RHOB